MKRFAAKLAITGSVTALSALALAAAPSHAVTTFGSTLANPATAVNNDCNALHECTIIQAAAGPSFLAAGGLTAPSDGVVVRFRLKSANAAGAINFRVLHRSLDTGLFTGIHTGEDLSLVPGINVQEARVPVQKGDIIGVNCCQNGSGHQILFDGGVGNGTVVTAFGRFGPNGVINDGSEGSADGSLGPIGHLNELLLNADLEADVDGDGYGDETQDLCPGQSGAYGACSGAFTATAVPLKGGKATLTANLPGTGTLSVEAPAAAATKKSSKKKKQKKVKSPFKPASITQTYPKPSTWILDLKPTGATKKKLKQAKKGVKATFDVVYTPTGGSASRQTLTVKLPGKKKKKK